MSGIPRRADLDTFITPSLNHGEVSITTPSLKSAGGANNVTQA